MEVGKVVARIARGGLPWTGDFRGAMPSDEDERCIMLDCIIPLLVTLLSPNSLEKVSLMCVWSNYVHNSN